MSKMRSEYAELKSMATAEMLGVEYGIGALGGSPNAKGSPQQMVIQAFWFSADVMLDILPDTTLPFI